MKVTEDFSSECLNTKRGNEQLKIAWKRMKKDWKSEQAANRRKKFKTGGGPQSLIRGPDEKDKIMESLLFEQDPLGGIPDDDFEVDNSNEELLRENDSSTGKSTPAIEIDETPSNRRPVESNKITTKVASLAEELHKTRVQYIKEEHELKMKVLNEELTYWQEKRASLSHPTSSSWRLQSMESDVPGPSTIENTTVQFLKYSLNCDDQIE